MHIFSNAMVVLKVVVRIIIRKNIIYCKYNKVYYYTVVLLKIRYKILSLVLTFSNQKSTNYIHKISLVYFVDNILVFDANR